MRSHSRAVIVAIGGAAMLMLAAASRVPLVAQTPVDSTRALVRAGIRQVNEAHYDSARTTLRSALERAHRLNDDVNEASALVNIGKAFNGVEAYDSALAYYRLGLLRPKVRDDARNRAGVLQLIGSALYDAGRRDSALIHFRQALDIGLSLGDGAIERGVRYNLGLTFARLDQPDSALTQYAAALPLIRAAHDSLAEASTLTGTGQLLDETGREDSAIVVLRQAIALSHAIGAAQNERVSTGSLGMAFASARRADSALTYLRRALALNRDAHDRSAEVTTLGNIATVFSGIEHADSTLIYLRASLAMLRVQPKRDRLREALLLKHISSVYEATGQADSALTYVRRALPALRAAHEQEAVADALRHIGAHYRGDLAKAVPPLAEALTIERTRHDMLGESLTLNQLGLAYWNAKQSDSALVYFRASLAMDQSPESRRHEATSLNNMGLIFLDTGHPDSALTYFTRALRLHRAAGSAGAETLTNIGYAYRKLGIINEALAYYDSANALLARRRSYAGNDASTVAAAEKARGIASAWVRTWLTATRTRASDVATASALAVAERGRAQGLRELIERETRTRDAASELADTIPGADLTAEAARELAPLRRAHAAMLYYFLSGDTLATWLLTASGALQPVTITTVKLDTVTKTITALRAALGADAARTRMARGASVEQETLIDTAATRGVDEGTSGANDARALAANRELGALLIPESLTRLVPAGVELVIVPHGALGLVPFASLAVRGDSLPLGVRYAIRYAPSLRALDAAESRVAATGAPLVVGDPAMPRAPSAIGMMVALRDLPAARSEGDAVAKRFKVAALTGDAATETTVRGALANARVVHLATHGLAYGTRARVRNSYVALAPDATNDGLLTIGELLDDVPPLAADLVVLSACQTGLGNLQQAEGTVGFQRALLAKGARSVLVSLWSVDDESTAMLMQRFYAHWLGPDTRPARSKSEALRLAQRDVRAVPRFASPRYWAAFQLVGAR